MRKYVGSLAALFGRDCSASRRSRHGRRGVGQSPLVSSRTSACVPANVDCLEARLLLAADLTLTQLQSVASSTPGSTIDIQWTARNSGADAADAFAVEFYLSADEVAGGPDDVVLGSAAVTGLAASNGTTGTRSISVTLPPASDSFWTGDMQYHLLAWVDAFSVIAETNEDNNTRGTPINITGTGNATGDLTGVLNVPASGAAGGSINADWSVTSTSTSAVGPFDVEFLISLDDQLDASDVSIGVQQVATLGAGGTVSRTTSLNLPARANPFWTGDTNYFVLMRVDSQSVVPESDETNNLASDTLSVTNTGNSFADLTGALMLPTSPVDAGTDLSFTWEVTNTGVAASVATEVEFYLSSSPGTSPGATPFLTRSLPALAVNATNGVKTEVYTLPPSDSPIWDEPNNGVYYIVMFIDRADDVPESDPGDANNEVVGELQVNVTSGPLPDLVPDRFVPPTSGTAGASISVSWRVKNTGQGAAGAFGTMFYLSDEQGVTPTAPLLATAVTTSLAGNNTTTGNRTTSLTLPARGDSFWSRGDGTYYLIMAVDDFGAVTESNELNNLSQVVEINVTGTMGGGGDGPTLDIDLSGGALDIFTDGILIARHMVGFTGNNLIRNAVGTGAQRSTAGEISTFLNGPGAGMLDVDGNGTRDVFTDGILIARYMVGFTGNNLIRNAIGASATRTTAAAIIDFLNGFQPPAAGRGTGGRVAGGQVAGDEGVGDGDNSGLASFAASTTPVVAAGTVDTGSFFVASSQPDARLVAPQTPDRGNAMAVTKRVSSGDDSSLSQGPVPLWPVNSDSPADVFVTTVDLAFAEFDELLSV